jgi:predicted nucleic acid-binding protein
MRWIFGPQSVFFDASAYAAIHVRTDHHNRDATAISKAIVHARRPTITTNFIVAETHAVVLARVGSRSAFQTLGFIDQITTHIERVSAEDELDARRILEQYDDKTFSYTDATSFAVMERLGLKDVFTFDRHFEQFGFSPLKPS